MLQGIFLMKKKGGDADKGLSFFFFFLTEPHICAYFQSSTQDTLGTHTPFPQGWGSS